MPRAKAPGVAEIEDNFSFHPATEETGPLHDQVRDICKKTALALNKILPPGRHRAMAITHVQEAMWAANTSVAVDHGKQAAQELALDRTAAANLREPASPAKQVAAKKTAAKKPAAAKPDTAVQYHEDIPAAPVKRTARRPSRP